MDGFLGSKWDVIDIWEKEGDTLERNESHESKLSIEGPEDSLSLSSCLNLEGAKIFPSSFFFWNYLKIFLESDFISILDFS